MRGANTAPSSGKAAPKSTKIGCTPSPVRVLQPMAGSHCASLPLVEGRQLFLEYFLFRTGVEGSAWSLQLAAPALYEMGKATG